MLPRPASIFDTLQVATTGAPPPLGKGAGQLYIVVRSFKTPKGDMGPAALLIKEKKRGVWGPPGGLTDVTDHSPLHAALREFEEEVGADWRNLANAAESFQIVRIMPGGPQKSEAWMMLVDLDASEAETALFGEDRSGWSLEKRMMPTTPLSNEAIGYAFVTLDALANADVNTGAFKIRNHTQTLRHVGYTRPQAKMILMRLK